MTEPCQEYSRNHDPRLFNMILMAFVVVIILTVGISTITLFMIQSGNNDQELNKQAIASIKAGLGEVKNDLSILSAQSVSNQSTNVEQITALHSKIHELNLSMVYEFSEEYKFDEIRKSEILEALKYVDGN